MTRPMVCAIWRDINNRKFRSEGLHPAASNVFKATVESIRLFIVSEDLSLSV